MSLLAACANAAWWMSNLPAHAAFARALNDPRQAQDRILRSCIQRNAATRFGREHHFDRIQSVDDFRRLVPLRTYDEFSPFIDRIAEGEPNVLTASRVTRLAASSGSTRAAKLIPYTAELQAEFNRAIGPWIVDLFAGDAQLAAGCAYWSISPVVPRTGNARRAIPVGFEEDSAYLGGARKRLVDSVMAVPSAVRHCPEIETFRYVTLRFLLARRDLRLISVWHPSFLLLLLDGASSRWDELIDDIARGTLSAALSIDDGIRQTLAASLRPDPRRAAELRAIGANAWPAIWPHLRLISAWGSAHAAGAVALLRRSFPGIRFQPKGLLATEAFVTIPFRDHWPLAIRSHHFELIDDTGRSYLAGELRIGDEYSVVVTTAGGLYRYRLGDRVRVARRLGRTPSLEFIGRADHVIDRFGEKLSEGFVAGVLERVLADLTPSPAFAMLAPDGENNARYTLFLESESSPSLRLARQLDAALRQNPHYAYCRDLGQLAAPRVYLIHGPAYPVYAATCAALGMRIGDLKPAALSGDSGWIARFPGRYVE